MTYYLINGVIGALVAMFIAYVSRTNYYVLAGLIPLFPTFTLFAYINAYNIGGVAQLKEVILFGVISVISYIIYVAAMYACIHFNLKFGYAVFIALSVWSLSAYKVFLLAKDHIQA